jgi:hypothetical protein
MSSPRIVVGDLEVKAWIPAYNPRGMIASGSSVLNPEFVERPVSSLSKGQRMLLLLRAGPASVLRQRS